MANSGSIIKNMGSYYRLKLDWSQTVNSNNTSTITTNLYLVADYSISSTATKTATTMVNGSSRSKNFTAGMSAGSKLIQTETWTVAHNSDGTRSVSIGFSVALNLTLSGVYYGTVSNSQTVTLDPANAPASTGTINAWTIPNNFTYTITRHDSSYSHVVELHVSYGSHSEKIGQRSIFEAGTLTWTPTVDENKAIVSVQRRNSSYYSANARLLIHTYKGGTYIGSNWTSSVLVSSPGASTATVSPSSPQVSSTITVNISRASSTFVHLVELSTSPTYSTSNRLAYVQNVGTSTTFNLNTYRDDIMAAMGTANSITLYIRVHTFYDSQVNLTDVSTNKVRTLTMQSFTVSRNDPPTWGSTPFTYQDTVSATTAITGSNQILVQGKSIVRISFPSGSLATAGTGASISSYTLTLGTFTRTWTPSTIPSYVDVPITTLTSNAKATLIATDNYGQTSAPKSIDLIIYPYSAPTITIASAVRSTSTTTTVNFLLTGKHSPLNGGTNYVHTVRWGTTFGSYPNTLTRFYNNTGDWQATGSTTLSDDAQQTYYFEIEDRFGTKTRSSMFVAKTQPIFFIDATTARVGVGKAPEWGEEGSLDVANGIYGTFKGTLNADTAHVGHVIGNPTSVAGSAPTLRLNSWQDSATLAINSNATNYSSKIGFWRQGVETGSIERYWSNNELRITSSYGMRLAATNGITMASATTFNTGATFNDSTLFAYQPVTSNIETGYCGVSGTTSERTAGSHIFGQGVNFKMSKNYIPSSVSFTRLDSSLSYLSANATQITEHGFFLYITSSASVPGGLLYYWRGLYTA